MDAEIETDAPHEGYRPPPEGQVDHEREDLLALLASPGWHRLCDHVARDWTDAEVLARLEAIVLTAPVADEHETAAQILAARRAVNAVMSWARGRAHQTSVTRARSERRRRA